MQISDGNTGYFCAEPEDDASRVVYLLRNPMAAELIGAKAKRYVEEHFLLPCRMADYLRAIGDVRLGKRYTESIISYHPWYKMSKRKGDWCG